GRRFTGGWNNRTRNCSAPGPSLSAAAWPLPPGGRGAGSRGSRSALAPALDRARVEEGRRRHHAVALEDEAVLHHEAHVAQDGDGLERVPAARDPAGEQ